MQSILPSPRLQQAVHHPEAHYFVHLHRTLLQQLYLNHHASVWGLSPSLFVALKASLDLCCCLGYLRIIWDHKFEFCGIRLFLPS